MKKLMIFVILNLIFSNFSIAQNLTKEETLGYLKNILQGQVIYYHYGSPIDKENYSGSSFTNETVLEIEEVNLNYDVLQIKIRDTKNTYYYYTGSISGKIEIYKNCICIVSDENKEGSDRYSTMLIAFTKNSLSIQEKVLNTINYLKKFIEKDPFDN